MSKYTTEVRNICETLAGYKEGQGQGNVNHIIALARPKIFDFPYPIFDTNYKSVIETKILKRYYTREICAETYGLWKHYLDMRLNEIMPYYNQLYQSQLLEFNPFYDVDVTTDSNRGIKQDENTKSSNKNVDNTTSQTTVNDTSENAYSDTPQGSLQNVRNLEYLTDASRTTDNSTNTTNSTTTNTGNSDGNRNYNSTDEYLEHVKGKRGGQSYSALLNEYRQTFLNIDVEILDSLSDLFFNLW